MEDETRMILIALKEMDKGIYKSVESIYNGINCVTDPIIRYHLTSIAGLNTIDILHEIWDGNESIRESAISDCYNSEYGRNYDDVDQIESNALEYFFLEDPDKYIHGKQEDK